MTKQEIKDLYASHYGEKRIPVDKEGLYRPQHELPPFAVRPAPVLIVDKKQQVLLDRIQKETGLINPEEWIPPEPTYRSH